MCLPPGCFVFCRNRGRSVQEFFTKKNPKLTQLQRGQKFKNSKTKKLDCNDHHGLFLKSYTSNRDQRENAE